MAERASKSLKFGIMLIAGLLMAAQCTDARLTITAPTSDFGRTIAGTHRMLTFTVTNSGGADAILGPVSTEGLGLGEPFSLSGGTCVTGGRVPASGGTCTLEIRFSPNAVGSYSDDFSLAYTYTWNDTVFDARSVGPLMHGENPGVDDDDGGDFGEVFVGETQRRTVTLRNYHGTEAVLDGIDVVSSNPAFVILGGTCGSGVVLAARGGTCTWEVEFTPNRSTYLYLLLAARYHWADGTTAFPANVLLRGTGVVAMNVSIHKPGRVASGNEVDPEAFPFGPLSTGSVVTKEFWVTNRHPEAVLLTDVSSAGLGLSAPYSLVGGTCLDEPLLAADFGQCSLRIRYAPAVVAPANDSIDVAYRLQESGTTRTVARAVTGAGVPVDAITSISAGDGDHVCAQLASGNIRCWGYGPSSLGYGNSVHYGLDYFPNSAGNVNVGGSVTQVAAALRHTCALLAGGTVRCWGTPQYGQLGYGNVRSDNNPPESQGDVPVGERVLQVSTGGYHTCAVLEGGRARCWGPNFSGQLGYGHPNDVGDDEVPSSAGDVRVDGFIEQIVTGAYHTCARLSGGGVRCWGWGDGGVLGYGAGNVTIGDNELPSVVGDLDLGAVAVDLAAGAYHTCALLTTGNVRCWGKNEAGQLGYGHTRNIGDDETPAAAGDVNVGGPVRQVSAGWSHTCALLTNGNVRCWGGADALSVAKLGYGNTTPIGDDEPPASAGDVKVGGSVSQVVAGRRFTCALLTTQKVRCWGDAVVGYQNIAAAVGGWLGYGSTEHIGDNELPFTAGDVPVQ